MKIPGGGGVGRSLKSQLFERKYKPKLEFRGMGRGFQIRNPPWEGNGYFLINGKVLLLFFSK